MEKELIREINNLIAKPEYLSDINNGLSNPKYLDEVHALLKSFLDKGYGVEKMTSDLGKYMLELRSQKKDGEEELILEAVTFLEGHCAPEWSLKNYGK